MNRAAILAALAAEPWAITSAALQDIVIRMEGMTGDLFADADPVDVEAVYASRSAGNRSGTVAVVPVLGPIAKRDTLWSMLLGGTSTTRLTAQLRALAADDSVATILLNVDSPGGTVSGLPELAAEVRRTRESKHVVAIANDLAASAAYWVAAQADEMVATPEALVGSVGVFVMHQDVSKAMEDMGIKATFISAGKYKTEGNPFEPLSDEARDSLQGIVDSAYAMFVGDVAKGRGVTPGQVKADYGEGRVLTAKDAKAAGMVDRIESYSQTVARLSGVKVAAGARAEGGTVTDAEYVVGDRGPETLITSTSGVDITTTVGGTLMMTFAAEPEAEEAAEAARRARFELDRDAWLFGS